MLCSKLSHTRFEPSASPGNAEIGDAKSVMDYIFRWIELRFLSGKPTGVAFVWRMMGRNPKKGKAQILIVLL